MENEYFFLYYFFVFLRLLFINMCCAFCFGVMCDISFPLSGKRYNEVAYATTHNGQSYKKSMVHNQDKTITEQLNAGIRAIKIPLWYGTDEQKKPCICACHGVSKSLLLNIPEQKIIEQVPSIFRDYVQHLINDVRPALQVVQDALRMAYGATDDSYGISSFPHGMFDPACQPFKNICNEVALFLRDHRQEIITLILEDFTENIDLIASDITSSKLNAYIHTQDIQKPWPTLGELVDSDKRLIILICSKNYDRIKEFPWLCPLWDFAWDTQFSFKCFADMRRDSVPNRGKEAFNTRNEYPKNKLFIVYHFITPFVGGDIRWAKRINKYSILKNRLEKLTRMTGHIPNFVQVDFFEYPHNDIFRVINSFNGIA
jgi:hypothetical protein